MIFDPTLPFVEIEVGGKVYKAVYRLRDLAAAEAKLIADGYDVTLLFGFKPTLGSTITMFAAAIQYYHPEIGFEAAMNLVTAENAVDIAVQLDKAWRVSVPDPASEQNEDPSKPTS